MAVAGTWNCSQRHAGCVTCQNTIVVGNRYFMCYYRRQFRRGCVPDRKVVSLIRLGDDKAIETSGICNGDLRILLRTRKQQQRYYYGGGASAHAVYATNATVNLGENATIGVNSMDKAASIVNYRFYTPSRGRH